MALASLAMLAALLPMAASAGTLNTVVLDDGTCGHNLQLGSDPTSSSSSTPWFLLYGDGGAASYGIFIDGASIGTFNTTSVYGYVCIHATTALAQGGHTLTGNELAPHAGYTVTPFAFSVDTVPPAVPSPPALSPNSDSGVVGDGITSYTSLMLTGTSEPGVLVRVYDGATGVGGARADSSGHWLVMTITLSVATHVLSATATDQAGNTSAHSGSTTVSIVSGTATVPGAPSLTGATAGNGSVSLAWTAPVSNGGSAITGYKVYRSTSSGGETLLATLGVVTGYLNSGLTNGVTYYYKVSALNAIGEGALSAERSATPVATATVPTAPTGVAATPYKPHGVSLTWSPSLSKGSVISAYRIYRATSSGGEVLLATVGNVTTFIDTGTSRGVTYYYKVSAVNGVGESALSVEVSAIAH